MEPYFEIFPDLHDPVLTLVLKKKTGSVPRGTYGFIECYCTEPGCDCRRVTLLVLNEKTKQKAVICFGFDQKGPMAGPYLDTSHSQTSYAPELLGFFVDSLNCRPDWLDRMYRQYRSVREMVDGRPYRARPFPKPGLIVYRVMPPPDLEAEIRQSLKKLRASSRGALSARRGPKSGPPAHRELLTEAISTAHPPSKGGARGMAYFVERYRELGTSGPVANLLSFQDELRQYLAADELAGEQLAALLPALFQQSPQDDEGIDAGLRLLFDTLDVFRIELECRRPRARERMERFQRALAERIFMENEDLDLCAAVSSIVLQSRVEILPVLREANSRMLQAGAARSDLHDLPGEEILAGVSRSLESMGVTSPFEGAQEMLQLFVLNEPEVQTALVAEMLHAGNPFLCEIAALLLFHHEPEVHLGVSRLLAATDGRCFAPQTLRRLIVSRNWFAGEIRKNLDEAITSARKGRVECAPLASPPAMTVYASCIDGAGAQSFQVVVPVGKGHSSCSILLKQGEGVADAFVVWLKTRRELNDFLTLLKKEASFIESTPHYLDERVCQALSEGASRQSAPNCRLMQIAELLGRDRWRTTLFDAGWELRQLQEELAARQPKLLDEREYLAALEESASWHLAAPVFSSWFEEDDMVDREVGNSRGKRRSVSAGAAIERIHQVVLEDRRAVWLERLVLTALWLKSSPRPPFAWHRVFHVAQAVSDQTIALRDIPLMLKVAKLSFDAYLERRNAGSGRIGYRP